MNEAQEFKLLSGELKIYVKTSESGNRRPQSFCPECGTPIHATSVGVGSKVYAIRLGTAAGDRDARDAPAADVVDEPVGRSVGVARDEVRRIGDERNAVRHVVGVAVEDGAIRGAVGG